MTGLPEIGLDGKLPISMDRLREEIDDNVTEGDRRILDYLFLREEGMTLVKRVKAGETFDEDEVAEMPEFMQRFLLERGAGSREQGAGNLGPTAKSQEPTAIPEDMMSLCYYEWAMQCQDRFVSDWFTLNFNMTNVLTALLARKNGWNVGDYVLGDGEIAEMLRMNKSKDFDLSKEYDFIDDLMKIVDEQDPVQKEKRIDAFKWVWLEERTFDDFFSLDALFAYLCKVEMVERWERLDVEQGKATFKQIIEDLRNSARVPEV